MSKLLFSENEIRRKGGIADPKHFKTYYNKPLGMCVCILLDKTTPKNTEHYSLVKVKMIPLENLPFFLNTFKNKFTHYTLKKWPLTPSFDLYQREEIEKLFLSIKYHFETEPHVKQNQLLCWKTTNYIKKNFDGINKKQFNRIEKKFPQIHLKLGNLDLWHFQTFLRYYSLHKIPNWIKHYYDK